MCQYFWQIVLKCYTLYTLIHGIQFVQIDAKCLIALMSADDINDTVVACVCGDYIAATVKTQVRWINTVLRDIGDIDPIGAIVTCV